MALTKVSRGLLSTSIVDNGNATAITIDGSENVGIGTGSPAFAAGAGLEIEKAGTATLRLQDTTNTANGEIRSGPSGIEFFSGAYGTSGDPFSFSVSGTTALTIDSSRNVGIGTDSPSKKLVISDGGAMGVEISPDDSGNGYSRIINYDRTTNQYEPLRIEGEILQFSTGTTATEKARLDASGNLLIATTDAAVGVGNTNVGHSIGAAGYAAHSRAGNASLFLNRTTSDGEIARFSKDGTSVGSIGVESSNNLLIEAAATDHAGLLLWSGSSAGTGRITPRLNGANSDGAVDLGRSSQRFKDLYLSGMASMTGLEPGIVTIGSGSYFKGNATNGYRFNNAADTSNLMIIRDDGTLLVGTTGAINSAKMSVNGNTTTFVIHPALDNNFDCGHPSYRWDDVRATNGTIQTSDRNEKQDIAELTDAEQRVAVAAKGLMRKFRWISSVQKKGDEARIHFGIIAQDLQAAFEAEGLDAGRYAMFISDTWTDEETGEERTRLGVRYSELLAFIISAI